MTPINIGYNFQENISLVLNDMSTEAVMGTTQIKSNSEHIGTMLNKTRSVDNVAETTLNAKAQDTKTLRRSNALHFPIGRIRSGGDKIFRCQHHEAEVESSYGEGNARQDEFEDDFDVTADLQRQNSFDLLIRRAWQLQVVTEAEINTLELPRPDAVLRKAPNVRSPHLVIDVTSRNSHHGSLHVDGLFDLDDPENEAGQEFGSSPTHNSSRQRLVKSSSGIVKRVKQWLPRLF